jgi:hypothetical protein
MKNFKNKNIYFNFSKNMKCGIYLYLTKHNICSLIGVKKLFHLVCGHKFKQLQQHT